MNNAGSRKFVSERPTAGCRDGHEHCLESEHRDLRNLPHPRLDCPAVPLTMIHSALVTQNADEDCNGLIVLPADQSGNARGPHLDIIQP